jgi:phosphatidyl-myo-inositol dimannoside synthase
VVHRSLLVTVLFAPQEGGIQRYLYTMAKAWPGPSLHVLAPSLGLPAERTFDRAQAFVVSRVPFIPHITLLLLAIKTVQLHVRERIDLIQCGTIGVAVMIGMPMNALCRVPYIVYTYGKEITEPCQKPWQRWLVRRALKHAVCVVTISRFTQALIEDLGIEPNHIELIHPIVDWRFCAPVDNAALARICAKYNLSGRRVLLTVGRLVSRKGHETVIRSLPALIERHSNVLYLMIGQGPYQRALEALVGNLDLGHYVQFLGYVEDEDLLVLYHAAEVFVMVPEATLQGDVEGFGIVYLEASAAGLPIVAGNTGGIGDAVIDQETGLLVPPGNSEDLATVLLCILGNSSFTRSLGEHGRDRVLGQFTETQLREQLSSIFGGIVDCKNGTTGKG